MSVKYNIVERGRPGHPEAGTKFYPSIKSSGRVSLRELSRSISSMCTVSAPDTMAVLESLLTIIPEELARGNIVELGDFGNFWLRSQSVGAEQREKVFGNQIINLMPRFNAGKEFKKALSKVEFVRG
jgi:predicted histone-like DNA-binding protein